MEGVAVDLAPTTFMPTLTTTIALNITVRWRVRAGKAKHRAGNTR
ncbi:MAG: hypothetical protein ACRC1J_06450 [Sandaracinobacteroides sp.]